MPENPEKSLQIGQVRENPEKELENQEETLRKDQVIETLETIENPETLENQEEIEKNLGTGEIHKEAEEEIMTLDKKDSTQMTVLEEKVEEEKTEETMAQREQNPMAIGTHEISAKRFHAWGNL